jgi:hypothetical protein
MTAACAVGSLSFGAVSYASRAPDGGMLMSAQFASRAINRDAYAPSAFLATSYRPGWESYCPSDTHRGALAWFPSSLRSPGC